MGAVGLTQVTSAGRWTDFSYLSIEPRPDPVSVWRGRIRDRPRDRTYASLRHPFAGVIEAQ